MIEAKEIYGTNLSAVGRIKFFGEKQSYKVMAFDRRYIICQKPFNAKKTYLYTIVDLKKGIRGADNCGCAFDYDNTEECKESLKELNSGELEISYHNWCTLRVDWLIKK